MNKSFLFSVRDDLTLERLSHISGNEVHHSDALMFATQRNELVIWNNCNKHCKNQSNIAGNYKIPPKMDKYSEETKSYLAGAYNFCVEDIEVFQVFQ